MQAEEASDDEKNKSFDLQGFTSGFGINRITRIFRLTLLQLGMPPCWAFSCALTRSLSDLLRDTTASVMARSQLEESRSKRSLASA
jgi:hypothetical protein